MKLENNKVRIFISYSRKDIDFVIQLAGKLKNKKYFAYFDLGGDIKNVEGGLAPSDIWWEQLKQDITSADVVIFVVSPDSANSKVCGKEIEWAQQQGKRLIPIIWKPISFENGPKQLTALNLVLPFSEEAAAKHFPFKGFKDSFQKLCKTIDTDIEWFREGRHYLTLAQRWKNANYAKAQLLRIEAVNTAEIWAAKKPNVAPLPAEVIFEFFKASREKEQEDKQRLLRIVGRSFISPVEKAILEGKNEHALRLVGAGIVLSIDPSFQITPELWPLTPKLILERKAIVAITEHSNEINGVVWHKDGIHIMTYSRDCTCKIWNSSDFMEIVSLIGHEGSVNFAEWAPNNETIVTASSDNTAILWHASDGKIKTKLIGHKGSVMIAHFSPNSEMVLTISSDGTARVWESNTGTQISLFEHYHGMGMPFITSGSFSKDSKLVVTTASDGKGRIWNPKNGRQLAVLAHEGDVMDASFHEDCITVATAGCDNSVRIWNLNEPEKEVYKFTGVGGESFGNLSWSPEGRRLIASYSNGSAYVWSTDTYKRIAILKGHTGEITSISWNPDKRQVLTTSYDKTARIWDSTNGQELVCLKGHEKPLLAGSYSPNGLNVITGSYDGTARIWISARSNEMANQLFSSKGIRGLELSQSNKYFLIYALDEMVTIIDSKNGNIIAKLKVVNGAINCATFSPNEKTVAISTSEGIVKTWDFLGNYIIAEVQIEMNEITGNSINDIKYSHDSKKIALVCHDQTLRVWDSDLGHELLNIKIPQDTQVPYGESVEWSPDGKFLIVGTLDYIVWIFDSANGKEVTKLSNHTWVRCRAKFNYDGSKALTISGDKTARIWNIKREEEILKFEIPCNSGFYLSANWNPRGDKIITTSDDKIARIWDAHTGVELMCLVGHEKTVTGACFTQDSKYVLTSSLDGSVRLWDITKCYSLDTDLAVFLAAGLAGGLGQITNTELSDILLKDSPRDLFKELMDLIPEKETDVKRAIHNLKSPIHPYCYRSKSFSKIEIPMDSILSRS